MKVFLSSIFFLIFSITFCSSQIGYIKLQAKASTSHELQFNFSTQLNFNCTGYLGVLTNPIGHFHIYFSEENGSCNGWAETNVTAASHKCMFATNGGPFDFTRPSCLGNIVSDRKIIQVDYTPYQNFGLTQDGFFILGNLSSKDIESLHFDQLITGFGWLVYNNSIIPKEGGEIAPRTMIGVNRNGELIILEVDGIEKSNPPVGLTLYQGARWMQSVGAYYAINLDGGGSSAVYYNGSIVDFPTCNDVPKLCVRPVTTITCVK